MSEISKAHDAAAEVAGADDNENRVVLPPGWKVIKLHDRGGTYANDKHKLVCVFTVWQRETQVVLHVAARRTDGRRPTYEDMAVYSIRTTATSWRTTACSRRAS